MFDTLRMLTPPLNPLDLKKIVKYCKYTSKGDFLNQNPKSRFIYGDFKGSYSSNIHFEVRDYYFEGIPKKYDNKLKKWVSCLPKKVSCPSYLVFEFSFPKLILGQNAIMPVLDPNLINKLRILFFNEYGVSLPLVQDWAIQSVDFSQNFEIPCATHDDLLHILRNQRYSRRQPYSYPSGVGWGYGSDSRTTFKIYLKLIEQKAKNKRHLKNVFGDKLDDYFKYIENFVRFEVRFGKKFFLEAFKSEEYRYTEYKPLYYNVPFSHVPFKGSIEPKEPDFNGERRLLYLTKKKFYNSATKSHPFSLYGDWPLHFNNCISFDSLYMFDDWVSLFNSEVEKIMNMRNDVAKFEKKKIDLDQYFVNSSAKAKARHLLELISDFGPDLARTKFIQCYSKSAYYRINKILLDNVSDLHIESDYKLEPMRFKYDSDIKAGVMDSIRSYHEAFMYEAI